jgi:phosphoribosylformylglycinamidine cyclo-ligase
MGESYKDAGVNLDRAQDIIPIIKEIASKNADSNVISQIGGFCAHYKLGSEANNAPIISVTSDGVGTKTQIASALKTYNTIGIDLVAMLVDDLVCGGSKPLFMLDYLVVQSIEIDIIKQIISGISEGCSLAGISLIGGETAEHPDEVQPGHFDLAGFAVGSLEESSLFRSESVENGDVLIGISSKNLRSNGFSLARHVLLKKAKLNLSDPPWPNSDKTLGEILLEPSIIYSPAILRLRERLEKGTIKAAAHITGGGIKSNLKRVIPVRSKILIENDSWPIPKIFTFIQNIGDITDIEMENTFNMGIGMVLVVKAVAAQTALQQLEDLNHEAYKIGEIKL